MSTVEEFDLAMAAHARDTVAAGLRFQAAALRAQADLLTSQAFTLEQHARDLVSGEAELPQAPVRFALVSEESERGEPEEEVANVVPYLVRDEHGLVVLGDPDGEGVRGSVDASPAVVEWLDLFADRLRASPHFVEAVNEAADAGRVLDVTTARIIAERVGELRDAASRGRRARAAADAFERENPR